MRIAEFVGFRPTLRYFSTGDVACPVFMGEPARHRLILFSIPYGVLRSAASPGSVGFGRLGVARVASS
jgi:hypothetical protein